MNNTTLTTGVYKMKEQELLWLLSEIYDDTIPYKNALKCFKAFTNLFMEENGAVTEYLLSVIEFNKIQRLKFRNRLAEKGYELTPNQLNQYIFLLIVAMSEYMDAEVK
tara:strand:- start:334 stop:657 length:324 start_codon:yes stop_codon:yes gene_type:complete